MDQDEDDKLERWLREEVAPTYDAVKADPSLLIPLEEVFRNLEKRHEARVKAKGRQP